jgi:perosamine synthetase
MSDSHELAIHGGERAVPAGAVRKWPPISDIDRRYVLASLDGDNHAFGPNCTRLQEEFAAWNGNRYGIATNSGTAALHMAVAAVGCGAGDQVIVPAYSWSSSATCILHHNCIPVFVDVDYDTMNMDVGRIEAAITPRTRAIIVVHLHGLSVDMQEVLKIARRHNLAVIEDACQAHGATFQGRKVGTWGDCAAFSLNQNKSLCSGEGGLFVTDNQALRDRAQQIWSFGETRTPVQDRDYHAYALGWMYRGNDLTAAFARSQLTRLDEFLATQRSNAAVLLRELAGTKGLVLPYEPPGHGHTYYNFTSRIEPSAFGWSEPPARLRDAIMKALQAEGVPVGIWQSWILPAMTVFQAKNAYGRGCPWSCPHGKPVAYDAAAYPQAQRHCDKHFGMTTPLRAPNGPETVKMVAAAFRKVFEAAAAGRLDVDRILRPAE